MSRRFRLSQYRKFALTAHVAFSVGWLGAVAGFLPLAVTSLTSQDASTVRAVYLAMESVVRLVIVPLSFASLLTGLVQSLGTPWGLFRHYWVLMKFLITTVATIILLEYMQTLNYLAGLAAERTFSNADLRGLRSPMHVIHSGAAMMALLMNTTLSVYKPPGMTPYGRSKQQEQREAPDRGSATGTPRWVYAIIALVVLIVILHRIIDGVGDH